MLNKSFSSLCALTLLALSAPADARIRWAERDNRAVFLHPRRFGQEHPAVIDKLSAACPGQVCGNLAGGAITRFRTAMTGELFALLKEHSILADLLSAPTTAGPAFLAGVERGWSADSLAAALFSVRAGVLLERLAAAEAASFVSGRST